ncbi:M23 family peptidase [Dysgonomonas sp. 216]|uniref:M23 family metallopeptidase n=1 Tax=Dysgonomonas sp. 216 TaxID=2302934 RepID=UPI0013D2E7F8|nr:M23 family metallopeptidase [Dysgonomonas sp. 216]NDW18521.1 M23 family peptidase [Dysgonomonas sp. 216]
MKKNVYYKYNSNTLTYERVYPSLAKRLFIIIRNLTGGIILGAAGYWAITTFLLETPKEVQQKKEYRLIRAQYEVLQKRMDEALLVVKDIQQRDDNMYRAIFHADPIPSSIRNSGYGGVGRYDHLSGLESSDLIVQTTQKMDILSKQIYIQSKSLDAVLEMAKLQKDRLKHIPSIQPVSNKDLSKMASGYGMRVDPIYGTTRFHAGMDFAAKTGTDIYATGNGTVIYADWKQGYGKCIIVDHGFGYQTLYAHMDEYKAKVGQKVIRGEKIGEVGNTGKSTGSHLHYEVHVKGQPDNPAKYYFMDLSPEEYDQMLRLAANHGQVMD